METALRHRQSGAVSVALTALIATICMSMLLGLAPEKAYASSSVEYIALFGADTWKNGDGTPHPPASDLNAVLRIDSESGTISILTIPRDVQYKKMKKRMPGAKVFKANAIFRDTFNAKINSDWNVSTRSNYDSALKAAAKKSCQMISDITGIKVKRYIVVDLYTYQTIIDKLQGIKVNLPLKIKNYRLYSDGKYYSVNGGKAGNAKLNSWDAMIAARAREPYRMNAVSRKLTNYKNKSDYTGKYPQLLSTHYNSKGKAAYYFFDGDGVRQFLNRRAFANIIDKGIDYCNGDTNYMWSQFVSSKLIWTNIPKSKAAKIAKNLTAAKQDNKLVIYGASIVNLDKGQAYKIDGVEQWLIPMDKANTRQAKATVKQFKAGKPMTSGWAAETILGLEQGAKKKVKGITYRVTSNSTVKVAKWGKANAEIPEKVRIGGKYYEVSDYPYNVEVKGVTYKKSGRSSVAVVKAPNERKVTIPAKVRIGSKRYKVTSLASESITGKKVRTIVLGSNVKKISPKAFKGSKATKLVLRTAKLKKALVKQSLSGSSVKTIKVLAAEKKQAKTIAEYRKIFTMKNSGSKTKISIA